MNTSSKDTQPGQNMESYWCDLLYQKVRLVYFFECRGLELSLSELNSVELRLRFDKLNGIGIELIRFFFKLN